MDLAQLRRDWVGVVFDTTEFHVDPEKTVAFARACGETDPRFTDPGHPAFQAPVTYTARFTSQRVMPEGFPAGDFRRLFDGGKCVEAHAPVPAPGTLVATSQIADVYEKTGRSGSMLFLVHRMEFRSPEGSTLLSTVDWRLIQREAS